jgi:hypothetical protein
MSKENSAAFDPGYWQEKEKSAIRLLCDYVAQKSSEAEKHALLNNFVNRLKYGDVVITFNWDNLIEKTLYSMNKKICFSKRDPECITILKLHGSISWGHIPNGYKFKKDETGLLWLSKDDGIFYMQDHRYTDMWDVLDIPPVIIPPIASKTFSDKPYFETIWYEAFNSLMDTKKISIVGYSIPNDDLQARTLLVSALNAKDQYIVVDPNLTVCGKYYSLISPKINYIQSVFSQDVLDMIFI